MLDRYFAALLVLSAPSCAVAADVPDACAGQLAGDLVVALESRFDGFRAPREADNLAEDVAYAREQGRDGCLGIAHGDFDGDRRDDFLIAMTPQSGHAGSRIVVALATAGEWVLEPIATDVPHENDRRRTYVVTLPAGRYDRSQALEGRARAPWHTSLYCPRVVAAFGSTESTTIVACRFRGEWSFVQSGD